jgi:hypothetical protein
MALAKTGATGGPIAAGVVATVRGEGVALGVPVAVGKGDGLGAVLADGVAIGDGVGSAVAVDDGASDGKGRAVAVADGTLEAAGEAVGVVTGPHAAAHSSQAAVRISMSAGDVIDWWTVSIVDRLTSSPFIILRVGGLTICITLSKPAHIFEFNIVKVR